MLTFIIAILLLLLSLMALALRKTYYYVPEAELKRQARTGDPLARTLYRAVAYGPTLRLLLWVIIGVSTAVGLELFVRIAPVFFGIVVVAIMLWLGFAWMPSTRLTGYGARLTAWSTPAVAWLLSLINPVASPLASWWHQHFPLQEHTGAYERDDLLQLLGRQARQADNRISPELLGFASNALRFDVLKVRDVVVPRKAVKSIGQDDAVGPILLDELHATGHARFPVHGKTANDIIGTLRLITLDEARSAGKVRDYMDQPPVFLHESDTLAEALQVIYHAQQQLFVVVNSFDEYVGIVTLEDILARLIGRPVPSDFDAHHDRAAVAAKHPAAKPAGQPQGKKTSPQPEKIPETDEKVVK